MTTSRRILAALFALSIGAAAPSLAVALDVGDQVGTTEAEIRAALEAEGYDVSEIQIEIEATRDGEVYEIELSLDTGDVLEIELNDDEDDD